MACGSQAREPVRPSASGFSHPRQELSCRALTRRPCGVRVACETSPAEYRTTSWDVPLVHGAAEECGRPGASPVLPVVDPPGSRSAVGASGGSNPGRRAGNRSQLYAPDSVLGSTRDASPMTSPRTPGRDVARHDRLCGELRPGSANWSGSRLPGSSFPAPPTQLSAFPAPWLQFPNHSISSPRSGVNHLRRSPESPPRAAGQLFTHLSRARNQPETEGH
jgi:hypothetical protein